MAQRRRFSAEYKREAVAMLNPPGVSVGQIAAELGIGATVLGRWRRDLRQESTQAFPGHGRPREDGLVLLRRELARVCAANTGVRQSEILNLQWCNVDLFRRTITLLEQKNGGRDTLPVNAKTFDVLKARAKVRSLKTDYVFYNGAGNRMDARDLLRVFYPVMRKADVKRFRFHDLRHTFATRLVQAGCDLYTVQKLGRWKTISMVMRYAHHHLESLRAGIEILDRVPAGVSTVLAHSANYAVSKAGRESAASC